MNFKGERGRERETERAVELYGEATVPVSTNSISFYLILDPYLNQATQETTGLLLLCTVCTLLLEQHTVSIASKLDSMYAINTYTQLTYHTIHILWLVV